MPSFCSECGTKLLGNENFCPACGFKLTASTYTDLAHTTKKSAVVDSSQLAVAVPLTAQLIGNPPSTAPSSAPPHMTMNRTTVTKEELYDTSR
jgi:hypothetical protein